MLRHRECSGASCSNTTQELQGTSWTTSLCSQPSLSFFNSNLNWQLWAGRSLIKCIRAGVVGNQLFHSAECPTACKKKHPFCPETGKLWNSNISFHAKVEERPIIWNSFFISNTALHLSAWWTSPFLPTFLKENLFCFKSPNYSFWLKWVGIWLFPTSKLDVSFQNFINLWIFKGTCANPIHFQVKGKKAPISHERPSLPLLPQTLRPHEAQPIARFHVYFVLLGIFLSFTSQRDPVEPETGNPGGWSPMLFLPWICHVTAGKPPRVGHFASVSPSCAPPAACCPPGTPSPHPKALGCQEGQRVGAGDGLAALRWR